MRVALHVVQHEDVAVARRQSRDGAFKIDLLPRTRGRRGEEELTEESAARAAQGEGEIDLERAIARLPAGYRHVLVLHDVEGYTHEEICRLLEISVGTSKSQLHHARRAMRAALTNGRVTR